MSDNPNHNHAVAQCGFCNVIDDLTTMQEGLKAVHGPAREMTIYEAHLVASELFKVGRAIVKAKKSIHEIEQLGQAAWALKQIERDPDEPIN